MDMRMGLGHRIYKAECCVVGSNTARPPSLRVQQQFWKANHGKSFFLR